MVVSMFDGIDVFVNYVYFVKIVCMLKDDGGVEKILEKMIYVVIKEYLELK